MDGNCSTGVDSTGVGSTAGIVKQPAANPGHPESSETPGSKPKPKDPTGESSAPKGSDKDSGTKMEPGDSPTGDSATEGDDATTTTAEDSTADTGDSVDTSDSTESDSGTTTSEPETAPEDVPPNIGPFVPAIERVWLQVPRGGDKAHFEIVVDPSELEFIPASGDKARIVMDVDGEGGFKALEFERVDRPSAPTGLHASAYVNKVVFRSVIKIDKDQVLAAVREYNQVKRRDMINFTPGTPEVQSRHVAQPIDENDLFAGRKVDLSDMTRMFPLASLGAVPLHVNRDRSLLIRDLEIIEDPARTINPCAAANPANVDKRWTFAHLMGEMAKNSGLSTQDFVAHWLDSWSQVQSIHSADGRLLDQVSADTGPHLKRMVLDDWRKRSGGSTFDLSIAPFRLLSIVYRPDLGVSSPMLAPQKNSAGQLRFVFGMMQIRDTNHDGDALDFFDVCRSVEASVIFEYVVPFNGCHETKGWANDILRLSDPSLPTARYLDQLEGLTEKVVRSGAAPDKPLKSALGQIRTNEIAFSKVWQMREFILPEAGDRLVQTTVKENPRQHDRALLFTNSSAAQTPFPHNLDKSEVLFDEVQSNINQILRGRYTMPEFSSAGQPLLGGIATVKSPFHRWDHPALRSEEQLKARFNISINTCSGCHTGETSTLFYHIFPSKPGTRPHYSPYLDNSPHRTSFINRKLQIETHEFDETSLRRQALYGLANQVCDFDNNMIPVQVVHNPLKRVH